MKKGLLLIGVMMLTLSASAQKFWTLQDCIDYAMENNITLQKSKLDKSTATETLKGSKAALLPTLNASTNQNLGYQPWKDTQRSNPVRACCKAGQTGSGKGCCNSPAPSGAHHGPTEAAPRHSSTPYGPCNGNNSHNRHRHCPP